MNANQIRELHDTYNWEIASHVQRHEDATAGDPNTWIEKVRQSCRDITNLGLPWPRSFAYPNGSRNLVTDRAVFRLFQNCGLTGHPSKLPVYKDEPSFFSGWCTTNGVSNTDAEIEKVKAYVRESVFRGEIPVLGFHGITDDVPNAAHHLSRANFTKIVEWLASQGYTSITMGETLPQNMIADPGFESYVLGYPWVGGAGWSLNSSDAFGNTGFMGAQISSGATGSLYQNTAVKSGVDYRVRVRVARETNITSGSVAVQVQGLSPINTPVGSAIPIANISTANTSETEVTGVFRLPSGCNIAKLEFVPKALQGICRVSHVSMYKAELYDPLA